MSKLNFLQPASETCLIELDAIEQQKINGGLFSIRVRNDKRVNDIDVNASTTIYNEGNFNTYNVSDVVQISVPV
jgi:hypothetical protein